jgi:hypothetical protein
MKSASKYLNSWLLLFCVFSVGCTTTVTPVPIKDSAYSWDGNAYNSGILGFQPDGSALITTHARDRYNALINVYGKNFTPPLKKDDGCQEQDAAPCFYMSKEALVHFMTMNRWSKERKEPK